jgi:pimeloyl-ACP methyl ester carboxylesterase
VKLTDPIDPESPFMIEWYASPTPVDPDFLRRQRADAARIPVKVWLAILDQGLTGLELQSTLPRLVAPTLLIWGAKDPIFGAADRNSLQRALPKAKVIVYPRLGHNAFWEEPQTVGRDLNRFLAN